MNVDISSEAVQFLFWEHINPNFFAVCVHFRTARQAVCTDKKENLIFLIYKEIQSGAVAKSYMRKGLIYEEMRKYFPIYEEAVSHIIHI
jgi:hypothetical protein